MPRRVLARLEQTQRDEPSHQLRMEPGRPSERLSTQPPHRHRNRQESDRHRRCLGSNEDTLAKSSNSLRSSSLNERGTLMRISAKHVTSVATRVGHPSVAKSNSTTA